jgi:hypothetical protein
MRRLSSFLLAFLLAACGGSTPTDPGGGGGGGGNGNAFSATIDGTAWSANQATITSAGNTSQLPGGLIFSGGTLTQPSRSLVINLGRISGPGTYPLGVNTGTNAGGTLTMVLGSESWWTPLNGDGGTVTISSMANGRMQGTFTATLVPLAGGSGTVQVTNGQFNLPINPGYSAPAADDRGSTVEADLGGMEFHGATIVGLGGGTSLIGFTASNLTHTVILTAGPAEGTGTLPLQHITVPLRKVQVIASGTSTGYGGTGADVGTMTITAVTGNRMAGTFTGRLGRVTGGGSLQVSGSFDVRTAQ